MKKKSYLLSMFIVASFFITSCSNSDDSAIISNDKTEQKNFIEETSTDFVNNFKVEDFSDAISFEKSLYASVDNSYDSNDFYKWFNACLAQMKQKTSDDSNSDGSIFEYYTNYDVLYMLSSLKKHVIADNENKKLNVEDADDFEYIFTDKDNKECKFILSTSGNSKKFYLKTFTQNNSQDNDGEIYRYYYDRLNVYIMIPENLQLSLVRDNKELMKLNLRTKLDNDFTRDSDITEYSFDTSADIQINKYDINIEKLQKSNTEISAKYTINKDNKQLLSFNLSALGVFNQLQVTNFNVDVNLMNKVQFKGTTSSSLEIYSLYMEACQNPDKEEICKESVGEMNKLMDLGIYYNNRPEKRANILMKALPSDENGTNLWFAQPVINFNDGTDYSTMNSFFNEENFSKFLAACNQIELQFSAMMQKGK